MNRIDRLYYNKCCIYLKDSESEYLTESLEKDRSLNNIEKSIEQIYYNSNVRYFTKKQIKNISKNLSEEIGRNWHKGGKPVSNLEVILNLTNTTCFPSICPNTGMYTVEIKNKAINFNEIIYFKSEGELNSFKENLKIRNINL